MQEFILISAGGIIGVNARYYILDWAARKWGTEFPYGTLFINVLGSLLLGLFMTLIADRLIVDPRLKLFFSVGLLGAFTTFSTYTYESVNLFTEGQWTYGLFNLLGSALLGASAVAAGMFIGKILR